MPLTVAARNLMLEALRTSATTASLHTGDPGTTGANELTGGTPAYARQAITWNAASAGGLDNNANPVFNVPAGKTVSHWGIWNGATFLGGGSLSTSETYAGQGLYTLNDVDVTLT